ncbi:MAG: cobalamin biosynthesis protein, partial [Hyphomicrobiaceae bacterium]
IGHRNARFEWFGKSAARIDELANLTPARRPGVVLAVVSPRPRAALQCMWREAGRHRSPNAGWPEAALAGGLDLRLSGPRFYGDRLADEPYVNAAAPDPDAAAISRALRLYVRAIVALALLLGLGSLAMPGG